MENTLESNKMKVEVWSDIMCPFCYIGKRHYETALNQFPDRDSIKLEWKSFQLDPTIPKTFEKKQNVFEYLADRKGISVQQSMQMQQNVLNMASQAGLNFQFDNAVVANSFDAHRIIQIAKSKGLGDEAEERFFKAYFTEGKDLADHKILALLGNEIGLTDDEVNVALTDDLNAYKIKSDVKEADAIGISGVPFFVFDRKFGVSGAQPVQVFLQTLLKSFAEWKKTK
jgi:protein disulfide-isomerase